MQWLAILTRDTGIPASERLQIKDEVVALDFDLAVSCRLVRLRLDEQKTAARLAAYEVSKIFASGDEYGDDVVDAADLRADPYVDKDTQIW